MAHRESRDKSADRNEPNTTDLDSAALSGKSPAHELCSAIVQSIAKTKHCELAEMLKIEKAISGGKISPEEAAPALEAYIGAMERKDFVKKTYKNFTYG